MMIAPKNPFASLNLPQIEDDPLFNSVKSQIDHTESLAKNAGLSVTRRSVKPVTRPTGTIPQPAVKVAYPPLMQSVYDRKYKVALELLNNAQATSLDVTDAQGRTALILAAHHRQPILCLALIEHGASVHLADAQQSTALHYAARSGLLDVVQALIRQQAVIDTANSKQLTPIQLAAYHGRTDVVRYLIDVQADSNADARVRLSNDLLLPAIIGKSVDTVQLLIVNGASVNQCFEDGWTPLIHAAANRQPEIILTLVRAGANVNQTAFGIMTPLLVAVINKNAACVQTLIDLSAGLNINNPKGPNILFAAIHDGSPEVVNVLTKANKALVNEANDSGLTPLYGAVRQGHVPMIQALLKAKAKVNHRDHDGTTSLIFAALWGRSEAVELLIAHHAKVNAENNAVQSPLSVAATEGHIGATLALLKAGARLKSAKLIQLCRDTAMQKDHRVTACLLEEYHDPQSSRPISRALEHLKKGELELASECFGNIDVTVAEQLDDECIRILSQSERGAADMIRFAKLRFASRKKRASQLQAAAGTSTSAVSPIIQPSSTVITTTAPTPCPSEARTRLQDPFLRQELTNDLAWCAELFA